MDDMTMGRRIAEQRKRIGLSQEALGEKMGVSRQAISKWEADGAVPGRTDQWSERQHPGLFLGLCGRRADPERTGKCCRKGGMSRPRKPVLRKINLYPFPINGTVKLSRFYFHFF